MTHGTTDMADGTEDGIIRIMVICTHIMQVGTEDGIHIGATTITTTST